MKLSVLIVVSAMTGCASPAPHGIENLQAVSGHVATYRGGQPSSPAAWAWLRGQGVTNVIKFNTGAGDSYAEGLGMSVVKFPISTWQQIFGPVAPQLRAGLTNIGPGTFVHCSHGVNRTGTEMMLVRREVNHWTKADARKEADALGWGSSFPALKLFWKKEP